MLTTTLKAAADMLSVIRNIFKGTQGWKNLLKKGIASPKFRPLKSKVDAYLALRKQDKAMLLFTRW